MLRAAAAATGARGSGRRWVLSPSSSSPPSSSSHFSTHYVGDDADALADIIKRHVVSW